jgi:hypothetical protein
VSFKRGENGLFKKGQGLEIEDGGFKRITFKGYDTMKAAVYVGHLTGRQESDLIARAD